MEGPQKMRVAEARVFRGPSIYAYRTVIRLTLDLGELERHPSDELAGFNERLLALIPTLQEHTCSYGVPGGFARRLREGTWIGHVVEHIAIELQQLAGIAVTYGKTRGVGEGIYHVVYAYDEERVGLRAGWLALQLIDSLLPSELRGIEGLDELCPDPLGEPFVFQEALEHLIQIASRLALGPTTRSLVEEALSRGIPVIRLDEQSLVQLGHGKHQQRICASVTSRTSNIAVEIAGDKELTNRLLREIGVPVPRNLLVYSAEEAIQAAEEIGYPVATKPLDVSHGRGVSLDLTTPGQVRWGFAQAAAHRPAVLVEQFLTGRDFRVLVINDKVIAVAERIPAHVVGDGEHTIWELVEIENGDPRRGIGHGKVLTRITLNEQSDFLLGQAGRTLQSVLPYGEICYLARTANLSTGGTAIDCTGETHFENLELARKAARVIGLDIAGIDIVTPDISKPLRETSGGIVEVNAGPGFRMHLQPGAGMPRNVAKPVLDMLFPAGTPSRIPIVAITGTNGKTTTARMVSHILQLHGRCVGLTTTDGIYIHGELYYRGDTTGPWSARMVLKDPTVDAAVLETARGGILREGLGFSRGDVGCVLNVQSDHLGMRGIETLEELAKVKSLVVEVVRRDGVSVLNADDPLTAAMRKDAEGRIMYFSMHGNGDSPLHLREHIASGGSAAVLQHAVNGDMIAIYDGDQYIPVLWTHQIPATLEGRAAFNTANALAAAAIAYALKVPIQIIRQGLSTFAPSFMQNRGRLNVYDELPFRVILDYGHNPAALAGLGELIDKLRPGCHRVIGVLGGTGDRRDHDIRELGAAAARLLDELILKDQDRRGRPPGETSGLLKEGAIAAEMEPENITPIFKEVDPVQAALMRGQRGDLVLIFADDVPAVWQQIVGFKEAANRTEARRPVALEGTEL